SLLVVTYYWHAATYLSPAAANAPAWAPVVISIGSMFMAWAVYDQLCRSPLKHRPALLFALLFALVVVAAWLFGQVFSPRAAFLHVGIVIATIMTGNVFFIIIPNQKIVVADLQAGRTPNPEYGKIAKLRSTHNNYFTLPVIFTMISN